MKKQILFIITVLLFCAISNFIHADNWQYNSTTSKWEKNITPEILKFNALNTATARQHIVPAVGNANPTPAITTGLSDGYFAVTGGQIGEGDVSDPTSVRQAFVIPDTSVIAPHALRFAQNTATVTDGGKAGKFLGYVNLNWYLPQKYSGYAVSFKSRVYNAGTFGLQLLVYDALGTQLGTTQNINAAGWNTATFTQTGNRPVRFKMYIPNTDGLVAYYETPEMLLTSAAEPTTRTISVTKSGNGTITATYATVRDQDTQTFTFTPDTGEKLIRVLYNGSSVTFSNNGNGTYSYTTPLLTANATLQADFSPQTFTGTGNWTETAKWNTGILPDASTNIIVNGTLSINTAALSANINVPTGNQLTITTGNSLTVAPGKQLSVSGTFTNNGTIILQSNTSGTATVTGNVTGNATVEQYLPAATERTWWYLASPVTGAAWTVFGSNQVGEYSETSRSYSAPFAATETLTAGKGYVVKMNAAQAANVYQFANKALNNGNIYVTLTRTVSETLNNKRGFNLVGNPYPSYLNWELAYNASTNVRSTIWYRTKGTSAMEFHTYNAALGVSVPTAASGYIPPMQAFWVKVDTDPVSPATV
ncbi:MAG: hypothetical protein PHR62_05830, partial [Paludibacter sp.]|nr:hypothetical protein [Paludibacter sp.]